MRAATRGSALALWQARHVAAALAVVAPGITVEEVVVSTAGDRDTTVPIHTIGGKGVFVKEVQAAVLDGRADFAVHSAKDLPADTPDGIMLVAVTKRADPRDALIGCRLADLPTGARVATGSVRRRSQLAWHRPDLLFAELRGNIATRLEKAAGFDAILMAQAAVDRLGLEVEVAEAIDVDVMIPQVGQGALAVECRSDDHEIVAAVAKINDDDSRVAVDAERAFLAELGGDCDLPAGAHAKLVDGEIEVHAMLASLDGRAMIRHRERGGDGVALGRSVARYLLDDAGGTDLLRDAR